MLNKILRKVKPRTNKRLSKRLSHVEVKLWDDREINSDKDPFFHSQTLQVGKSIDLYYISSQSQPTTYNVTSTNQESIQLEMEQFPITEGAISFIKCTAIATGFSVIRICDQNGNECRAKVVLYVEPVSVKKKKKLLSIKSKKKQSSSDNMNDTLDFVTFNNVDLNELVPQPISKPPGIISSGA
jgi:hypothetical protein